MESSSSLDEENSLTCDWILLQKTNLARRYLMQMHKRKSDCSGSGRRGKNNTRNHNLGQPLKLGKRFFPDCGWGKVKKMENATCLLVLPIYRRCKNREEKQCDQIWQNFATIGTSLLAFGKFLTVYFLFGKLLSLLWQTTKPTLANLWHIWANFHLANSQNIEK